MKGMGKSLFPIKSKQMKESLSVFFPAFNEEENIELVVKRALEFLPSITKHYEIIIIDDGSQDKTGEIADLLSREYKEVSVVHHSSNCGYGVALQTGFKMAKNDFIFFTDGDGQFNIKELPKLASLIENADIICGYRIKRADPLFRKVNARLYRLLLRIFFNLKITDINCAFKLFKQEVIQNLDFESSGALINAEILILAQKKSYTIKEVGVSHHPRVKGKQTGAKPTVILRAFVELFKLWRKLK